MINTQRVQRIKLLIKAFIFFVVFAPIVVLFALFFKVTQLEQSVAALGDKLSPAQVVAAVAYAGESSLQSQSSSALGAAAGNASSGNEVSSSEPAKAPSTSSEAPVSSSAAQAGSAVTASSQSAEAPLSVNPNKHPSTGGPNSPGV